MASVGHVIVGVCAGRLFDGRSRSMVIFGGLSLLPDADVIGFAFGVPYGAPWGHRGASHSLVVAAAIALVSAPWLRRGSGRGFLLAAGFAFVAVASHGALDALTDGGRGVALLWPFTNERYFAPWRPIPVAPIGLRFFSDRGFWLALKEASLFAPLILVALTSPRRRPSGG